MWGGGGLHGPWDDQEGRWSWAADFGHRGGATQAALHLSRCPLCLTHHPQGGGCVFSKPMFSLMNPLLAFYKLQNSQRGETEAASEGHRILNMLPPWHLVL